MSGVLLHLQGAHTSRGGISLRYTFRLRMGWSSDTPQASRPHLEKQLWFLGGCILPPLEMLGCHSEPPAGPPTQPWASAVLGCLRGYLLPPITARGRGSETCHSLFTESLWEVKRASLKNNCISSPMESHRSEGWGGGGEGRRCGMG